MDEEKKVQDNVITGAVGAFLGSLVGVLCIVVVGQLGYVASISGLVMGVCALKGYEMLGGGLSKKGAVVSLALIVVMTFLANRLDWAVSLAMAAEVNVFVAFRAMDRMLAEGLIEAGAYWGNLAMLYLFTLVGAVPAVVNGLRGQDKGDPWNGPLDAQPTETQTASLQVYTVPIRRGATRRLRLSLLFSMLLGCVACMVILLGSREQTMRDVLTALGCLAGAVIVMCIAVPYSKLMRSDRKVLARTADGVLWQVDLTRLNLADQFTCKSSAISLLHWDRLNADEQDRARAAMGRAIEDAGRWGSSEDSTAFGLFDLQVIAANRWYWKCRYRSASGRTKTTYIVRAYEGLALQPGEEPVHGPVPFHWGLCAAAAAITLALGALGGMLGAGM